MLFPTTQWWARALQCGSNIQLYTGDGMQHYNRYSIVTANGIQHLSVSLKGGRKQKSPISTVAIDYRHDWQRQHWGALYSAYGRAPYFEHYSAPLEALIYSNCERLQDLGLQAIQWLSREMRLPISFHPSPELGLEQYSPPIQLPAYHQVFEDRWGFVPNLSVIDLLMNEGPYARQYLTLG